MKSKMLHSVVGLGLTLGMGVATAGPAPASDILGTAHYQAMSGQQMASVTGEGKKKRIVIINRNTNTNTNTNTVCLALCAGGDINVLAPPIATTP